MLNVRRRIRDAELESLKGKIVVEKPEIARLGMSSGAFGAGDHVVVDDGTWTRVCRPTPGDERVYTVVLWEQDYDEDPFDESKIVSALFYPSRATTEPARAEVCRSVQCGRSLEGEQHAGARRAADRVQRVGGRRAVSMVFFSFRPERTSCWVYRDTEAFKRSRVKTLGSMSKNDTGMSVTNGHMHRTPVHVDKRPTDRELTAYMKQKIAHQKANRLEIERTRPRQPLVLARRQTLTRGPVIQARNFAMWSALTPDWAKALVVRYQKPFWRVVL